MAVKKSHRPTKCAGLAARKHTHTYAYNPVYCPQTWRWSLLGNR